jgi:AcrR family transcriptional regulator
VHTFAINGPGDGAHEPSGADIWNAIVQAAIGSFRTRAFHEVTLDVVAAESGLSIGTVLERFTSLEELVVATVQVWNAERMAVLVPLAERDGAVEFLRALVQENAADPSLARLLTAVVNIAATPNHPMAHALQRQWIQFHALVERALTRDVALGRESAAMDPSRGAEQLIAMYEGLQLQSMMRPGIDLIDAWDHAVARLRIGWTEPIHAMVWDL